MRQCLCSDYIRDQAAGFFFFELREFLCAILPACVLGDLLILLLCDDTILALRYIHICITYIRYVHIFTYIYLSRYSTFICLSVYTSGTILFFFFLFFFLFYTNSGVPSILFSFFPLLLFFSFPGKVDT